MTLEDYLGYRILSSVEGATTKLRIIQKTGDCDRTLEKQRWNIEQNKWITVETFHLDRVTWEAIVANEILRDSELEQETPDLTGETWV